MAEIALVIVNYRTAEQTCAAVEAVRRTVQEDLEIAVVDNASGDGSAGRIRSGCPAATVIEMPSNRGFAAGVNEGVASTTAETLLVLNPDTQVLPGAVGALVARMSSEPDLGVTGPLLLHADHSPRQEAYKGWPSLWSLFVSLCLPVGHVLIRTPCHPEVLTRSQIARHPRVARICGSAMAIRRAAWEAAGPMDEGFFLYFEEVEWQRRVVAAGWQIALTHNARVVHLVQGGEVNETVPVAYLRSAFRYMEGLGHSRRSVAAVVIIAATISSACLRLTGLAPGLRTKSRRMRDGYAAVIGVARGEIRGHHAEGRAYR